MGSACRGNDTKCRPSSSLTHHKVSTVDSRCQKNHPLHDMGSACRGNDIKCQPSSSPTHHKVSTVDSRCQKNHPLHDMGSACRGNDTKCQPSSSPTHLIMSPEHSNEFVTAMTTCCDNIQMISSS
jgi:hypothetical protein